MMKLSSQTWLVAVGAAALVTIGCIGGVVTLSLDGQTIPEPLMKLLGTAGAALVGLLTQPRDDDSKPNA